MGSEGYKSHHKQMRKIIAFICLCYAVNTNAQFTGHSGVYYLGTANLPISTVNYSNANISGVVVRFRWNDIEPTPGNYNWAYIDGEIAKAKTYNKKVCLQPLSAPDWMESAGVKQYYYIDKNTYHSTYGQVISDDITWDTIYVNRYKVLLQNLAAKYANNTTVSYINTIGGAFSRGLPDSVITDTTHLVTQPFWTTFNYNADLLGSLMNKMTDFYMNLFPNTHLWCSVDYVAFQTKATGQARNYLATIYTNYGIANYSDRFGLWREDIAGCNPNFSNIAVGSHWYIMQQNPCRTGAQMLWSVQDGPTRMNQCGILQNTKAMVLDSAVNKGLALGMRYLEIYGSDIADASLTTSIQQANNKLIAKGLSCNTTTGLNEATIKSGLSVYPNPANETLMVNLGQNQKMQVQILNLMGILIKEVSVINSAQIDISVLSKGIYFIKIKNSPNRAINFIKQ